MQNRVCTACKTRRPLRDFQRNSGAPDGRRSICKPCSKGPESARKELRGSSKSRIQITPAKKRFFRRIESKTYLITAAQNATPVDEPFLKTLEAAANHLSAELVIIPLRYKNPTSIWSMNDRDDDWWDAKVKPYLFNVRKKLCPQLVLCGDVKIQPTAAYPLQGFESLTGAESCILGHPKMSQRSIPVPHNRFPKVLSTTGVCTKRNYTDTRAGKIGAFHHFLGALIVEIKGKKFHLRQLNADRSDGSFIDLDQMYTQSGAQPALQSLGLGLGDSHARTHCPKVDRATFGAGGIVETLDPKTIVFHDVLDGSTVNPHELSNPFLQVAKEKSGKRDIRAEIEETIEFINSRAKGRQAVVVDSNHHAFLKRWACQVDWKTDPKNAEFYLETALSMVQSAKMTPSGPQTHDPFAYWAKKLGVRSDIRFLGANESFVIGGNECGMHGHRGPNGSRGSLQNLSKLGTKVISGHSHTPGIDAGHYQVGTSTPLRLNYNLGPSSWMNTHCVIYANGKRSLIHILDGEWRK